MGDNIIWLAGINSHFDTKLTYRVESIYAVAFKSQKSFKFMAQ